jgi:hypothetical protein
MTTPALAWTGRHLLTCSEEEALRVAYDLGAPICWHINTKMPVLYDVEMDLDRLSLLSSLYVHWQPVGKVSMDQVKRRLDQARLREQRKQKFIDEVRETLLRHFRATRG